MTDMPLIQFFDIYFRYFEVKYAKPHPAFFSCCLHCHALWSNFNRCRRYGRPPCKQHSLVKRLAARISSANCWDDIIKVAWLLPTKRWNSGITKCYLCDVEWTEHRHGISISDPFSPKSLGTKAGRWEKLLPNKAPSLIRLFFRPHRAALSCSLCCSCVVCSYGLWCCGTGHPKRWEKWGEWMISCQRNQGVNFWKSSGPIMTYDHLSR